MRTKHILLRMEFASILLLCLIHSVRLNFCFFVSLLCCLRCDYAIQSPLFTESLSVISEAANHSNNSMKGMVRSLNHETSNFFSHCCFAPLNLVINSSLSSIFLFWKIPFSLCCISSFNLIISFSYLNFSLLPPVFSVINVLSIF